MSASAVRDAVAQVIAPNSAAGEAVTLDEGQRVLRSAGETLSRGELRELVSFFRDQAADPTNDREVQAWCAEHAQTITFLTDEIIPARLEQLEREQPILEQVQKQIISEGVTLPQVVAQDLKDRHGFDVDLPAYMQKLDPKAQAHLAKTVGAGIAQSYDCREIEARELAVDHGHITLKGRFQRYPQGHEMAELFALSSQQGKLDGLDPRATILHAEAMKPLISGNVEHNVFSRSGGDITLRPSTDNWNGRITEVYDEASHTDHLAWHRTGPFASNFLIDFSGGIHALRAPRRSNHADNWGMGGGILTTGSLGRGWPAIWHGHVHAEVQNGEMVITQIGLSGRLCRQVADGELSLPDPRPFFEAAGFKLANPNVIRFENAEHGRNCMIDEARGIVTART
ncbi:MAG: hypothetical protein RIT81_27625 [Deltaproteobacteria bacterium]